jgi:hypothetical protein
MAIQRDIEAEKQALSRYTSRFGTLPKTSEEWSELHNMAYGENLPDEFKQTPKAVTGEQTPLAYPNSLGSSTKATTLGDLKQKKETAF